MKFSSEIKEYLSQLMFQVCTPEIIAPASDQRITELFDDWLRCNVHALFT